MSSSVKAVRAYISIDLDNYVEGSMQILQLIRPEWKRENIKIKVFNDGISNKMLGFIHDTNVILIRINGNMTDMFTDRQSEIENFEILHGAGCGPMLHCIFDNGLCYDFIEGDTLSREDLRKPEIYNLITREMVRFHKIQLKDSSSNQSPAVFKLCDKFLHLAFSDGAPPGKELVGYNGPKETELRKEFSTLREHLFELKSPIVYCHNDLLVNNIVFNNLKNSLHFIDFEYTGKNFQAFDIANHFCEFAGVDNMDYSFYPDRHLQLDWIRTYLKHWNNSDIEVTDEDVEKLYVQVNKFALAALFIWATWGLVQARYSNIDFDYINYTETRFREYFKKKKTLLL
uniref:ethanolamine kinase 2-like n=1 Tax=Styela clava TaxID=7725 RepID=UPI00193A37A6|nr:ethanolamine kinase 2-like [Styela clava]